MEKVPIWEKLNLSVKEAAEYSNIGRDRLYALMKEPGCPFILKNGKTTLIKCKEFEIFNSKTFEL